MKIISIRLWAFLLILPFIAQSQTITGTVSFQNQPLAGATIAIKGSQDAALSGPDGKYSITAAATDVLVISFIGLKTVSIVAAGRNVIDVAMEEDATTLTEVTVNAGYYKVKDKERTGSIARITSEDIETQPTTNILATMQGRMAGVSVTQESGIAGGGFTVNIRGLNSLRANGNSPLYIVDGVPYSDSPISDFQTSTSIPGDGNPLNSINPADIESLEVLKDADATAIYGSRGANGVVLLTTKRGRAGKPTFTVTATHSVAKVTRFMDLMDTQQYLDMRAGAFANDGFTEIPSYAYDANGTWSQTRYTDWQRELTGGTAEVMAMQASVGGGSESSRYLIGANYREETSVFPGDFRYRKGGARVSFDHASPDEKFKLAFSGSYMVQDNDLPWTDFVNLSRQLAPNAPALHNADGSLNWENSTWSNPLANLEAKSLSNTSDLIANAVLSYAVAKNFELKSNFGFTDLRNSDSRSSPSTMYNPAYNVGSQYSSIYFHDLRRTSWIAEPQLGWQKELGRSKLDVLAGTTFQQQVGRQLSTRASGFSSNSLLYDLASASSILVFNNDETVYKYQAYFGRVNYSYGGKYFLNLTGRRDGSSRFGPGRQFATFGAVGAAWLFHKETPVAANMAFLSFGKLRGSYGTTGNDQIGDYEFMDTFTSSGYQYGDINGLQPARLYNPDFGWEVNNKLEAAVELGFLRDRIYLTAAWYRNRSSNQLVGLPLPGTTGFTSIQANLDATVQNTGVEATLRTVNVKTKDFEWVTGFNITAAGNKLLSFPGLAASGYANDFVVGEPTTIRKLFGFTGVNQDTGLYEFEDFNGDGAITYADDRQAVRDFNPEFYGGLQNQFSWKGLQLDFLFQFVKQQNFNFANTQRYAGLDINQPAAFANSWQQPGDDAPYQLYTTGFNQEAMQAGEYFGLSTGAVSDASFIRLKNISLSYDVPAKWLYGTGCRLSLQAQNLITFTSFNGADPEFTQGGTLPPLRVISASLQVTF